MNASYTENKKYFFMLYKKKYIFNLIFSFTLVPLSFGWTGNGTEESPWILPNSYGNNAKYHLNIDGYYKASYANTLSTGTGEYTMLSGVSFWNRGENYEGKSATVFDNDASKFTVKGRLDTSSSSDDFTMYIDAGVLLAFIGSHSSNAGIKTEANTVIDGISHFFDYAVVTVARRNLTLNGTFSFWSDSTENGMIVESNGNFINNGTITFQRGSYLNILGTLENNGSIIFTRDTSTYVRGNFKSQNDLSLYNLYLSSNGVIDHYGGGELRINQTSEIYGKLNVTGNLVLQGNTYIYSNPVVFEASMPDSALILQDSNLDLRQSGNNSFKNSQDNNVSLVSIEDSSNKIILGNNTQTFSELLINNSTLTIELSDPLAKFIVSGEVNGINDYRIVIVNFSEDSIFFGNIGDNFDLGCISALDSYGNDLGKLHSVNGWLTLIPEPSIYAFAMGFLTFGFAILKRRFI